MNCTLNSKVIPADKMPVSTEVKEIATEPTEPKEDTVCKIYDLESEAWRSFKWDSLLSISYTFE